MYYCRSKSVQRADTISNRVSLQQLEINLVPVLEAGSANAEQPANDENKYDECLACQ
jgi:ribonucleoside-diphosphate reductase alpha chain